jgi:hypothetical protein
MFYLGKVCRKFRHTTQHGAILYTGFTMVDERLKETGSGNYCKDLLNRIHESAVVKK